MKALSKLTHAELCIIAAKWIKKHDQNILIPNCATVAIDMKTIESEQPDIIAWNGHISVMIEVKVGRGDFLKDHKKPFRSNPERGVGQLRYYCCPTGLIKESELPLNWGLLYFNEDGKIQIVKVCEKQEANINAERNMLISIIRRLKKIVYENGKA